MINKPKRTDPPYMQLTLVMAVVSAVLWVWWRRRVETLWQRPQIAPLSAQWLQPHQPDYALVLHPF